MAQYKNEGPYVSTNPVAIFPFKIFHNLWTQSCLNLAVCMVWTQALVLDEISSESAIRFEWGKL